MHYRHRVCTCPNSRIRTRYKHCPRSQGECKRRSGLFAEHMLCESLLRTHLKCTESCVYTARILHWALFRFFVHEWKNTDKITLKCMFWGENPSKQSVKHITRVGYRSHLNRYPTLPFFGTLLCVTKKKQFSEKKSPKLSIATFWKKRALIIFFFLKKFLFYFFPDNKMKAWNMHLFLI